MTGVSQAVPPFAICLALYSVVSTGARRRLAVTTWEV